VLTIGCAQRFVAHGRDLILRDRDRLAAMVNHASRGCAIPAKMNWTGRAARHLVQG
jgi:hypothetical protein